ncbi:MAG: hypothetical protein HC802_15955 [Caldilineaceae bacterium]|nr:hypothetical protein [Caldilineaceae bacterium]
MTIAQTLMTVGSGVCFTIAAIFWLLGAVTKKHGDVEGCLAGFIQILALPLLMSGVMLLFKALA